MVPHRYAQPSDQVWPDGFSSIFFDALEPYINGDEEMSDVARHFIGCAGVDPLDRLWVPAPEAGDPGARP